MKVFVRSLAGFNALFQLVVGALSVLAPTIAAVAFKVDVASPAMLALIRMFGGLLAGSGVLSALIARDPERDRGFVLAYVVCLFMNVAADLLVIGAGELRFDQLAVGMLLELVLAGVLVAHRFTSAKPAQLASPSQA